MARFKNFFIAAPHLAWFALFVIAPLACMLYISFYIPEDITGFSNTATIANYTRIFEAPYPALLFKSLAVALLTTFLCLLFSLPIALAVFAVTPQLRNWVLAAVCLPYWISALVRSYALVEILGRKGIINSVLDFFWQQAEKIVPSIGPFEPLRLLYSSTGVIIGLVYAFIPFCVLPIYASLMRVDPLIIEASRDLGASKFITNIKITLPLAKTGILVACFLVFIPTIGAFYIPEMLGGPNDVLFGNLLKLQFYEANNWPFGAALSMLILAVALVFLALPKRTLSYLR